VKYPGYSYKPRKRTTVKKKRRSRQDAGVDAEQKAMVLAAARGGSSVVGSPLLYAYEGLAPYSPTSTISWASSPGLKSSRSPIPSDSSAPLSSPPITPPTRTRRLTRAAAKKTSARHKIADAEAAASTLPLSPLATSPNGLMLITESPIQNHLPSLASSPSSPYFALPASPASTYTPEYAYDHLPQVGDALGTIGMHNMVSAYLTPIDYTGDAKDVHAQFSTFSFNPQVPDSHGVPQLFLQTQVPDTYVSPPSLSYDLPPPLEVPYEMALKPNGQDEYLVCTARAPCQRRILTTVYSSHLTPTTHATIKPTSCTSISDSRRATSFVTSPFPSQFRLSRLRSRAAQPPSPHSVRSHLLGTIRPAWYCLRHISLLSLASLSSFRHRKCVPLRLDACCVRVVFPPSVHIHHLVLLVSS